RFGTRLVEALPQGMVGLTTLVGRFPLIAQTAQRFLHLPATQTLALWRLQKTFGLGHQFFAQLIGPPALPAFEFAGLRQRRMSPGFQFGTDQTAMGLEQATHICS